ncbi:MAG: NAD(P)H-dependent oxidoreductase subunit E [Erysipelotrichaceae bacterium]|nr:NAD(P)H-dependent oxidoreductase subunit E [Erysipelotrichaceae bacterium]
MLKLNENASKTIDTIVERHKGRPGPVKLMLHDVQHELGYIPFEAMEKIAVAAGVSVSEVYGVVTFYTQFTTEPKGKHVVNVCMGTACYVNNAQVLLDKVLELTKAPINGTSSDGLFSVDATRCLGACGLAPVAIIDEKVYGTAIKTGLAEARIREIIAEERKA